MSTATTQGKVIHWARLYDLGAALCGGRARAIQRALLERAGIAPGNHVLDVGCGPGRLTLAAALAAGPTGQTLGIDPAPEMIALATRKANAAASRATFQVAAMEKIPAPDDHFDVVLASLVLHHLPPELQRRGVREVLRVLRPGGRLVVADFSATPGHGLGHILAVLGMRRGAEHAELLGALLRDAGFEAVEVDASALRALCLLRARKPASQPMQRAAKS